MRPVQILLADDHEVVRKGLRALLEAQPGWKVIAEAMDGILRAADIEMPLTDVLE